MANAHTLWYAQPAARWLEALPVGNGRLGAMMHGRVHKEVVQLNEESLWTRPIGRRENPLALARLGEVRQALLDGDGRRAHFLAELGSFGVPRSQAAYQTLGHLTLLSFGHHEEWASDYRRTLDLRAGMARLSYKLGDVEHRREIFASAPDQVIVVRLEPTPRAPLELGVELWRRFDGRSEAVGPNELEFRGRCGANGSRFVARCRVLTDGGTAKGVGDHLHISGATAITVLLAVESDFSRVRGREAIPEVLAERALSAIESASALGWEELRDRHLADHAAALGGFDLDLRPTFPDLEELPTDARLARLRQGRDDAGLLQLYTMFGRYLLADSSRPGSLPANLQGIWNESFMPAWDSKFTINVNAQMNYWGAETAGLPESHLPLFDLLDRMRAHGSEVARVHYGCRGFVAHHNTDLWADCAPLDNVNCGLWPFGAVWLALHLWEHYAFDPDDNFLAERAWPIMSEAARFLLDFAVRDEEGGLMMGPSLSPENAYRDPTGVRIALTINATGDVELASALFARCLDAAALLGIDDDICAELEAARAALPPLRSGRHGQLMEWLHDYEEWEPGHRHYSHLIALYPGDAISPRRTPGLARAARTSLFRRLSNFTGGAGGWSRAWAAALWARLGEGDLAYEQLLLLLRDHTEPNLMDSSPPGGTNPLWTFQIDGNLGAVGAACELLVQSHDAGIDLLPALPSAWPNGSVRGLRARGGHQLDLVWRDGTLDHATLTSGRGLPCVLRDAAHLLVEQDGQPVKSYLSPSGERCFATETGARYSLMPTGTPQPGALVEPPAVLPAWGQPVSIRSEV
jgi:alpha-L-fucosidase 2